MPYCNNCGHEIKDGYDYCPECGAKVITNEGGLGKQKEREPMKICPKCGENMPLDAFYCFNCGEPFNDRNGDFEYIKNRVKYQSGTWKNKWVALVLCIFLGWMGAHKYYEGKVGLGVLYTFTFGLFFVGWIIDIFILIFKPNPYLAKY